MTLIKKIPIRGEKLNILMFSKQNDVINYNPRLRYKNLKAFTILRTQHLVEELLVKFPSTDISDRVYIYLSKNNIKNPTNNKYTYEDAFFITNFVGHLIRERKIRVAEDIIYTLNDAEIIKDFYKKLNRSICSPSPEWKFNTTPQTEFKKRFNGEAKYSVYQLVDDLVKDKAEIQFDNYKRITVANPSTLATGIIKNKFGKAKSIVYNKTNVNVNIRLVYQDECIVTEAQRLSDSRFSNFNVGDKVKLVKPVTLNFIRDGIKNDIRWIIVKVSKSLANKLKEVKDLIDFEIPSNDPEKQNFILNLTSLVAFNKKDIDFVSNQNYSNINSLMRRSLVFGRLNSMLTVAGNNLFKGTNTNNNCVYYYEENKSTEKPSEEESENKKIDKILINNIIKTRKSCSCVINVKKALFGYIDIYDTTLLPLLPIDKTTECKIIKNKLQYILDEKNTDKDKKIEIYNELIRQKNIVEDKLNRFKVLYFASKEYKCNKKLKYIFGHYLSQEYKSQ